MKAKSFEVDCLVFKHQNNNQYLINTDFGFNCLFLYKTTEQLLHQLEPRCAATRLNKHRLRAVIIRCEQRKVHRPRRIHQRSVLSCTVAARGTKRIGSRFSSSFGGREHAAIEPSRRPYESISLDPAAKLPPMTPTPATRIYYDAGASSLLLDLRRPAFAALCRENQLCVAGKTVTFVSARQIPQDCGQVFTDAHFELTGKLRCS